MPTKTYAVDFESYWDDDLSVTIQGAVNYALKTHLYMVSIVGPGVEYVGPVEDAPWREIDGAHWVSHNAGFDMACYQAAVEKRQVPSMCAAFDDPPSPSNWDCTADLVAYLGVPRSLADSVKVLYGKTLDKAMRGTSKGKHWPDDFTPEQQQKMLEYALRDSVYCLQLWEDYSPNWPADEVAISRITRERALEGVCVDRVALAADLDRLSYVKGEALENIPWGDSGVILSHKKVGEYCVQEGIPAPKSLAEDSEECDQWLEVHGKEHLFVSGIRDYRKANRLEKIITGMIDRITPSGRMNFGLKYFGASNTGRWSGTDGLNMQNANKEPVFGVDIRSRLIAEKGKKFVICDLAQIEPRCSAWIVGDTPMMDAMAHGYGIYEAAAVSMGVWEGKPGTFKAESKEKKDRLYDLVKAQVLALGYGAGPAKFIIMAKMYCDLEIDIKTAEKIVKEYRVKNYRIPNMWTRLEAIMRDSFVKKEPLTLQLPSGRNLVYRNIHWSEMTPPQNSYKKKATPPQNGYKKKVTPKMQLASGEEKITTGTVCDPKMMTHPTLWASPGYGRLATYWGGKLFENVIQATARDVLAFAILNLERAGIPVLWSAHDEVICEVAQSFDKSVVRDVMIQTPPWLKGLVLDAEAVESDHYLK